MEEILVSVNVVVFNEEKRIKTCLASIKRQTYRHLELTVFDNHSSDKTKKIVENEFPEFKLIRSEKNFGFGGGHNRCIDSTKGKYVLAVSADTLMEEHFIERAVAIMERDKSIGALQGKIYHLANGKRTDIIDTTGFEIFRSRRIINRGHGQKDKGQYNKAQEIFSYEGALPFWRREALEESRIGEQYHDEDYFWYGDDIDLGWRMRLFGWKSFYDPNVIAYHERQTTHRLSEGYGDFIALRKSIPAKKRRLDWQNIHFTFIKNDCFLSIVKSFPHIALREIKLLLYLLFFEPTTLPAIPFIFYFFPRMFKKRIYIMRHKKIHRKEIERWFYYE